MYLKRLGFLFLMVVFLFTTVYADVENEEEINSNIQEDIIQASSTAEDEPDINSRSAVVIERNTQTILYGKSENEQRKMASTTKIMTATIVIENSDLNDEVTISVSSAGIGGSRLGLKANDKITVRDLLYGLLLKSGNDAAVALAEYVGGSVEGFAVMMNEKAQELGLENTHFVTPHGLDNEEHYTTAYELAILANYAMKNETFAKFVATKNYTVSINGNSKNISNTNELLGNLNGVYGVKTGFTNGANRCLVTACKRGNLDIICVVLGADTKKCRTQDSVKLIEYCFSNYEIINLRQMVMEKFDEWKEQNETRFNIIKGATDELELKISNLPSETYPVKKSDIQNIKTDIKCNFIVDAPLKENSIIGNVLVLIDDKIILNLDIVNENGIEKKRLYNYFYELLFNYSNYLYKSIDNVI